MAEVTSLITEFFSSSFTSKTVADLESSVKKVFSSKNDQGLPKKTQVLDRFITMEEVSWHDESDDCWIIIFDKVYDITEFLDEVSKLCLVTRTIYSVFVNHV